MNLKHFFAAAVLAATTMFADANVQPARILNHPSLDPATTMNMQRNSGSVKLSLSLNEKGQITKVKVLDARYDLIPAAVRTVHQWDYAPAMVDGRAVPSKMEVTLVFGAGL
jgi:TonB family protein